LKTNTGLVKCTNKFMADFIEENKEKIAKVYYYVYATGEHMAYIFLKEPDCSSLELLVKASEEGFDYMKFFEPEDEEVFQKVGDYFEI